MSRAESLFIAEAKLREAASFYAGWCAATSHTPEILNRARASLRSAAISYANEVRAVDANARKATP